MSGGAYYNEIDKHAAAWLRNLIAGGHIAAGDVDERSITEVQPDDLRGYAQCHFFAGIGGWSYALRLAGWPDDRPVWTGSCPCQPFSAAGRQRGSDDERHLWPAFFRLIGERRPGKVFGEQVAGAAGLAWWDHVAADMEGAGYAAAAANLGAHSVGAPHLRQRLYWVADGQGDGRREGRSFASWGAERVGAQGAWQRLANDGGGILADAECGAAERWGHDLAGAPRGAEAEARQRQRLRHESRAGCDVGLLAHADGGHACAERQQRGGQHGQQPANGGAGIVGYANPQRPSGRCDAGSGEGVGQPWAQPAGASADGVGLADATEPRSQGRDEPWQRTDAQRAAVERGGALGGCCAQLSGAYSIGCACPWRPWRQLEWLACSDGKARPTEPGLQPLAHGVSGRVGRLRAYGNAIVPQVAAAFIVAADVERLAA